jgi:adenylate cyclase
MLDGKNQPIFDGSGKQVGLVWQERIIEPTAPLADAAKGLGPFPLPKDQIAVDTFWAFKPSVDAPTIPAVALQLHALGAYDKWLDLLERADAPGVQNLPQHPEDLARASDVRALMRNLRNAFQMDPGLGKRIVEQFDGRGGENLDDKDRRLFKALIGLYQGVDERYLNFYGPPGSITNIPYHAFLTDDDPRFDEKDLDLTGKIVFVGFSDLYDPGQPDRFYTVFTQKIDQGSVDLSGVEILATALGNLLTNRSLRPSGTRRTVWIVLLFGLLLGSLSYIPPAMAAAPLTLGAVLLYAAAAQYVFNQADLWLPLATPILVQSPIALFLGLGGHYWLEHRQKLRVNEALAHYLPKNIAEGLTEAGLDLDTLNRVVHGTCLATDMSGFTSISENLRPRELARFMNDYFDTLAQPLKRHGVDITEFHADTIMCAWTATDIETVARHEAVLAALDVVDAVEEFAERHAQFRLNARIGLESGRFFLGHTGGGGQLTYSILGDCANTAARLEGLNKHVGTHILATQSVVEDLEDIVLRPLGLFQLVGKTDPRPVVEVLGRRAHASGSQLRLCEIFTEALEVFLEQKWAYAAASFRAVLQDYPHDGPSKFYLDRCRRYQVEPPGPERTPLIRMVTK